MAYGFSRSVTIDHTKCGSTNSSNFTMLFSGTYTYLKTVGNGGNVQNSNGYDIAFFSDAGLTTLLSWEKVAYNAATGAIIAWVMIPTLSASTDTVIYLAYGDSGISTFQGGSTGAAYDSNFKAAYHFGDGATLSLADSTANTNTLTQNTPAGCSAAAGPIGGAFSNGGGVANVLNTPITDMTFGGGGQGTISFWAYLPAVNSGSQWFGYSGGGNEFSGWAPYSDNNYYWGFNLSGAGTRVTGSFTGFITTSTWTKYDFVWGPGATAAKIYKNGALYATAGGATTTANGGFNFPLGGCPTSGNGSMNGSQAEWRIASAARSVDWLLSEYNNQNSPSTFYAISSGGGPSFIAARGPYLNQSAKRASFF